MENLLMRLFCFLLICFWSQSLLANDHGWVDITIDNGHIKFPVVIQGNQGLAILDSGAQLNAINDSFVNKHKLKVKVGRKVTVMGIFGKELRETYNDLKVEMFSAPLKFDGVVSAPLGHPDNAILLGANFMNNLIIQTDYVNQKIRFLDRESINLKKVKNLEMMAQKGSGQPIIKIRLNNEDDLWLLLDTGNNGGVMIERSVAIANNWLNTYPVVITNNRGVNSLGYSETFNVPTLEIGPFILENVIVSVPAEGQSSNLASQYEQSSSRLKGKRVRGILGYDVLKHFVLTIDYEKGYGHIALPN